MAAIDLRKHFSSMNPELFAEVEAAGVVETFPPNTEILREGQYVKMVPIVLDGLVKVITHYEDKELLLYYIQPDESCVMSFAASLDNQPSKIHAITEEETTVLLLPIDKVASWAKSFPDITTLFFKQYNKRYAELLETINHLLFDKLDKRLYDYLKEKSDLMDKNPIKISHRRIADEMGTAREVVSRVLKKLELDGRIEQTSEGIKILSSDHL